MYANFLLFAKLLHQENDQSSNGSNTSSTSNDNTSSRRLFRVTQVSEHVCMPFCTYVYIYMSVCSYTLIYTHIYRNCFREVQSAIYALIIYIYIHTFICIYIYMYTYIYTGAVFPLFGSESLDHPSVRTTTTKVRKRKIKRKGTENNGKRSVYLI